MLHHHVLSDIPLEILELDLRVQIDRAIKDININIDTLVHALNATGDQNLAMQFLGFISACQPFYLLYQFTGLLFSDKPGSLNRINQQFELWKLKLSFTEVIIILAVDHIRHDLKPELPEFIKIRI